MKSFISDEEKAQILADALPKDGEAVHVMRKGRLVSAVYRKWITGTQFAEVEYKGETIKENLYESLDGKETPQKIDLIHWHEAAKAEATKPVAVPLSEFERPPVEEDPNELLSRRFLCRRGGMLLVGPTGIGKSSFTMQAMVLWAIGLPFFDIQPAWQLKSLLIQAENDEGDIAEMRDGVLQGLDLSLEQAKAATDNVIVCTHDSTQSTRFFQRTVRPLLEEHRPDILVIDPALAYLGGEE